MRVDSLSRTGDIGDQAALLLVLVMCLAVIVATATSAARRRMRRGAAFVVGMMIGGLGLAGLMGLGILAWAWAGAGADGVARVAAVLPSLPAPAPVLPQVVRPSPVPIEPPRMLGASARILRGDVTHVRDGDTIEVDGLPIRFTDVNCAERGTAAGDQATLAMRQLVSRQRVTCVLIGRRSYDREIGTCTLDDGRDIGMVLVGAGMCVR